MKKLTLIALSIVVLIVSMAGCASTPVPTAVSLQNVPIYDYGERPDGDNYIMRFRKGTKVPVILSFKGHMIEGQEIEAKVKLSKNIYIYKRWLSYDNVNWQHGYLKIEPSLLVDYPNPEKLIFYSMIVTMPE